MLDETQFKYLTILPDTHPILRQVAEPVVRFDEVIEKFCKHLTEIMYRYNGIGIAAPQVGVSSRIIIVDGIGPMINPKLASQEGQQLNKEGCLTFPGLFASVKRASKIHVDYQDCQGNNHLISAEGMQSVCIQHEIDHLDGKLFVDYLSPMKLAMAKKKMIKKLR